MNEFNLPRHAIERSSEFVIPRSLGPPEHAWQECESLVETLPLEATDVRGIYALSPLQEVILADALVNERRDAYVIATLIEVDARRTLDAFVDGLNKTIECHDVLRTSVLWEGLPRPVQVVHRHAPLKVTLAPLAHGRDPREELKNWITQGLFPPFALTQAPLIRLHAAEDPRSRKWYAVLQVHRLICDQEMSSAIVSETLACCDRLQRWLSRPIPWSSHSAEASPIAPLNEAEASLSSKLSDIDGPTMLFAAQAPGIDGTQIEQAQHTLEAALAARIRACAEQCASSTPAVFHAAWSLVVARASGRDDIVFGTLVPAHPRLRKGCALGPLVNTVPLRLRLTHSTTAELLSQVDHELRDAQRLGFIPLPVAAHWGGIDALAPIISSVLSCRAYIPALDADVGHPNAIEVLAQAHGGRPCSSAAVTIAESGEGFVLSARAQGRVGARRILSYLCCALESLLFALERAPSTPAVALEVVPDFDRRAIEEFNSGHAQYPAARLIHELVEAQVQLTPRVAAVVCGGESLTYEELNRKANQLARHLRERGVGSGDLVAFCIDRRVEMIVGILGILKAGAGYVPLDPIYPVQRLARIIEDAEPRLLLTHGFVRHVLPQMTVETIAIDEDWSRIAQNQTDNLPAASIGLRSDNLAYVIYTSGSTGRPKGVMIEHRNVMSLWSGLEQIYCESGACHRVAVNASFAFDASVKQLVQMLSGRTLVLIPQEVRWEPSALVRYIGQHQVDVIDCTPSQLRAWISAGLLDQHDHKLRLVLIGGEPIDAELWKSLAQCSTTSFYNVYGPTESTVDATSARLNADSSSPHIGRPMQNRSIYILDAHTRPVPIGVVGELYIGGAGVARGYLKRSRLTAERFVPDPFRGHAARMYKTGDIGMWRADGTIEYLGRNDHQVKIRGFRVELGEIEAELLRLDELQQAVVIVREDAPGHPRLVAYVVPKDSAVQPSGAALRRRLEETMPDYMVPSVFVRLDRIPLTQNGKVDRKALPAPDASGRLGLPGYEAPTGEVEQAVANIWQTLLGVEQVGRHESFFELGGHSLTATQVASRIQSLFSVEIPVRTVFDLPRLSELSRRVDELRSARLLERVAQGGSEMEELLGNVAALTDVEVRKLLGELAPEGRS